jgi:hypothetical protein
MVIIASQTDLVVLSIMRWCSADGCCVMNASDVKNSPDFSSARDVNSILNVLIPTIIC